jgi:hypothetical protein
MSMIEVKRLTSKERVGSIAPSGVWGHRKYHEHMVLWNNDFGLSFSLCLLIEIHRMLAWNDGGVHDRQKSTTTPRTPYTELIIS